MTKAQMVEWLVSNCAAFRNARTDLNKIPEGVLKTMVTNTKGSAILYQVTKDLGIDSGAPLTSLPGLIRNSMGVAPEMPPAAKKDEEEEEEGEEEGEEGKKPAEEAQPFSKKPEEEPVANVKAYLKTVPPSVAAVLNSALEFTRQQRTRLLEIVINKTPEAQRKALTPALNAMSIEALQELAAIYSGKPQSHPTVNREPLYYGAVGAPPGFTVNAGNETLDDLEVLLPTQS